MDDITRRGVGLLLMGWVVVPILVIFFVLYVAVVYTIFRPLEMYTVAAIVAFGPPIGGFLGYVVKEFVRHYRNYQQSREAERRARLKGLLDKHRQPEAGGPTSPCA